MVDCRPFVPPVEISRENRELRALYDDGRRIEMLGLVWFLGVAMHLFILSELLLNIHHTKVHSLRFLTDPHMAGIWIPIVLVAAFFAFCLTACMVCWGRPRWVAWPFFVIGGGMIPEISMFRSDWSKFRTLFGAGRIDFARFQREYLDQEGQFGQLTEKDLVRLKYRVESGWEWDG